MKLCSLCSKLNVYKLIKIGDNWRDVRVHQPNFSALESSAAGECEMCLIFIDAALGQQCDEEGCSLSKAAATFWRAERGGNPSCFLSVTLEKRNLKRIKFSVPHMVIKDDVLWPNSSYCSPSFHVSNYIGKLVFPVRSY
jgi:hypothetical protein